MKCISCGGEIGLTDEKCPFCGREVTETAGYQTDLKTYRNRNKKSAQRVEKAVSGNVPIVISAVVMAVLLIAIVTAAYVWGNAYHFRSDAMRKDAVKNFDEYSARIQQYLEAGDYTGFAAFKEYHNIPEWEEPYKDLKLLWNMAYRYDSMVSNIESAVMFGQDARIYRPEQDVYDCRRAIWNFYYDYGNYQSEIETDPYGKYIRDMKNKADIILKVYLCLDDEAREAYLASSDIEQDAYLEGVLMHE